MKKIAHREVLRGLGWGTLAAAPFRGFRQLAFTQEPVIRIGLNYSLGQYFFDPIGLYALKGTKVRWEFPPGYGAREKRASVFPAEVAMLAVCPSNQIVQGKTIAYPKDLVVRPYPYGER